jgi:CHAT domain-containing protein/tetratricopeptide (TPR) repeat protein
MTRIFVHAWMPEFGHIESAAGSPEQRLFNVAELVRQGEFNLAEAALDRLEADATDDRIKFLVALFRQQLWQRRYLLLSGGRKAVGESRLDEMKYLAKMEDSAPRMNSLRMLMPPLVGVDAMNATAYAQGIYFCLSEGVGSRRAAKLNEETSGVQTPSSNLPWGANRRDLIEPLGTLGLDSFLYDTLGRTQHDLFRLNIEGQLAAADFDFENAKLSFQAGFEQASREGQPRSAAEFLLRLGDLEAAPYGDVLTFGYNISSENVVRNQLQMGLPTRVVTTPPSSALEVAEGYYRQAAETFARLGETREAHRLTIRYAHLARLRRDWGKAAGLYERAAAEAGAAGSSRDEVLAKASAALLTGAREPLMTAISTLVKRGDFGAALSLAELSHSWAARLWYFNRDLQGATARLLILTDALSQADVKLDREAVDPLYTLGGVYRETGRLEASIQIMQRAIAAQERYLATAEPASEAFRVTHPTSGTMFLAAEKSRQMANLARLSLGVSGLLWQEGSLRWKEMFDNVEARIKLLSQDAVLNTPETQYLRENNRLMMERNVRDGEILFKVQSLLSNTTTCEGLRRRYDELRVQLAELRGPMAAWRLDAQVSQCAPEHLQAAQAELRRAQPIIKLKRVLSERTGPPSFTTRTEIWEAVSTLETYFEAALMLGTHDVLLRWTDEVLRLLAGQDASWQYLRPQTETYRAAALTGLNQFDDARKIIINLMSDERSWALRPPSSKIAVLDLLVQLEARREDAEASLLALEQLRFEQERLQALRSGVEPDLKQSAEMAMLERRAATDGTLPPRDMQRLNELRAEVERADSTLAADKRPPTLENLRAALGGLPEQTTLLVYHVSPRGITAWRMSRNQPLKVMTLKASPSETVQLARGLEKDLANDYATWEEKSAQLYDRLIKPLGTLEKDETLIFVVQGALSAIPFEVLGESAQAQLLKEHGVAYAARLSRPQSSSTAPVQATATNGKALVVGLSNEDIPNAEIEATQIAALLGVNPLLGEQEATTERVAVALKDARWVHFATHGTIEQINPYLSRLSLARGERVEAWQLFRDAPQAEMIVLSACDTKREAREAGSMGDNTSLNSFAFAGGARWVVASLWAADDVNSSAIMLEFYRLLIEERLDQVQALQRAKLKIAGSNTRRPFRFAHFLLSARDLTSFKKPAR